MQEVNGVLPIILIHGFPFDADMWSAQAEFLRSARGGGRKVLTPNLSGFGDSPEKTAPSRDAATLEYFAEEIHTLIRSQGGKAIVGGMSMGGYILLALLRVHPEAVAGAMLLNTRADADAPEVRANRLRVIEEVQRDPATGKARLIEAMLGRLLGKSPSEAVKVQARVLMERQSPQAIIAAQSAMARRRDQNDMLATLKMPVLIVVGQEDVSTPPQVARAMHQRIAGSTLVEIPRAGHLSPLENPAAVNEAIGEFVRDFV